MSKVKATIAALGATLCLTGCFSLDTATSKVTGEEHVVVSNYGWRIFGVIPIFCGNATSEKDGRAGEWAFFRDDVTMDKLQRRFLDYASVSGREIDDLTYHNYDTIFMTIPWTGIPIPIPYVICYREIQISGVLR